MLLSTFSHIPGIGYQTEKRLWKKGLLNWDAFEACSAAPLPAKLTTLAKEYLAESRQRLEDEDPLYFSGLLPAQRHWRIFPHFRAATAYLDIETAGQIPGENHITTIALYDGKKVFHYVYGENLEDFPDDIVNYKVLVTYNGKSFDVPIIENHFKIRINSAHIDLCHVLRGLGYKGGLKSCEQQLGIFRGELEGIDGACAVTLWSEYLNTGDRRALETLLAYNIADAVNLEALMVLAYNLFIDRNPALLIPKIPYPLVSPNPVKADHDMINFLRGRSGVISPFSC